MLGPKDGCKKGLRKRANGTRTSTNNKNGCPAGCHKHNALRVEKLLLVIVMLNDKYAELRGTYAFSAFTLMQFYFYVKNANWK